MFQEVVEVELLLGIIVGEFLRCGCWLNDEVGASSQKQSCDYCGRGERFVGNDDVLERALVHV